MNCNILTSIQNLKLLKIRYLLFLFCAKKLIRMRIFITLTALIISSFVYTSCCKSPYPVAAITVSYPNLWTSSTLKAVRADRNNLSIIIDTIHAGDLNAANDYAVIIPFEDESPNYILYIENTMYIDTISAIAVERKSGCRGKIKSFSYQFNGQLLTGDKLTIN